MYTLSWAIRIKPNWQRKASDPEILSKWRQEALDQQSPLQYDKRMTENGALLRFSMKVDYVLAELAGYAQIADNTRGIERGCFDAIWYSDRLISDDLTERLKIAVSVLENVPDSEKDWHPGSNEQVLDLVHPSLYCIVYGRTHAYDSLLVTASNSRRPALLCNDHECLCKQLFSETRLDAFLDAIRALRPELKVEAIHTYCGSLLPMKPRLNQAKIFMQGYFSVNMAQGAYELSTTKLSCATGLQSLQEGPRRVQVASITRSRRRVIYAVTNRLFLARGTSENRERVTKRGRALSWPNQYQHRVSPFELADPSKPGHRKILAIFLVDPTINHIPSTTVVPPQQAEWATEALQESLEDSGSLVSRLPQEVADLVKEQLPTTFMRHEEAEEYRVALMKERKVFVRKHSGTAYGVTMNMCEH
ncbi:hypothetical protein C8R45DRAFT_935569 [Mycena sanguinolenta]|nr:hypothetical protein C8R45DRAFT_935569 [Mycena sanguinolenta]